MQKSNFNWYNFFSDLLVLGHNIHMLRLIKSDAEIKLLRESASLASRAITKVRSNFLSFVGLKKLVLGEKGKRDSSFGPRETIVI